ncbi:hypothetical protein GCM10010392_11660 [Streptomyces clavifer]|nr:hypothetical protein GCM10010392_11660 [Streptomyces clavifer]
MVQLDGGDTLVQGVFVLHGWQLSGSWVPLGYGAAQGARRYDSEMGRASGPPCGHAAAGRRSRAWLKADPAVTHRS